MNNYSTSIIDRISNSMNRIALFAIAAILAVGATACEEEISPDGLPYVERMVVRGVLTAGQPAEGIRFTRTLPVNYVHNDSGSIHSVVELADVQGYIEAEGTKYPLTHSGRGEYQATGLVVKSGVRYTLNATWRGKTATATTVAPAQQPTVDTIAWNIAGTYDDGSTMYALEALIQPMPGAVYSIEYGLTGGTREMRSYTNYPDPIRRSTDANHDNKVHLKVGNYYSVKPSGENYHGSFMVYAWEQGYYNFFNSYYNNMFAEDSDNPFGSQDRAIAWNVSGDGIGTFFARTVTEVQW
ncbi:MAG: DUF4249 family protein [Armatimonadetes bacterium]|nr:DUF4249 family protein [Armatimonadota bacterium]